MKKSWIWIVICLLIAIDLLSKRAFFDFKIWKELAILEPVFNTGISRGIQIYRPLVIGLSLLGIWFFFFLWHKKQLKNWIFILLIAGTLGNLIDRVWLGGVRDFVAIGNFPVFNLADCFLTFAVVILLRDEIFPCNCTKKTYTDHQ